LNSRGRACRAHGVRRAAVVSWVIPNARLEVRPSASSCSRWAP